MKSLEDAYERGETWLGYLWGPSDIAYELNLTPLEEPPCSRVYWATDKACAFAVADVMTAVHPSLVAQAPEVVDFLRRWHLDASFPGRRGSSQKAHGRDF